ncbi:MAG: GNAT family N-acetyltransferase [Clostridia bacterium]|nr:GNAT family N-acetyltransferase [Clostridia bacterium]MBQ8511820.1 GNAT family N-acetyltransferase [Clostridia bacterium]
MLKDYLADKPVLETGRLLMRPLTPEDAPAMRWLSEPELYTYWGREANNGELHPETIFIDPRPHVRRRPGPGFCLGIFLKSDGTMVGEMWMLEVENSRMAKVAYRIAREYWNQGIATEALRETVKFTYEKTELDRLWTDVDCRNTGSWRVLEKCGFVREGMIRQGKMVSSYCDYYIYGMLRSDYDGMNQ